VARRLADLFNQTGLMQISFDGLEGNWSTGMGQYGRTLFVTTWYDHLRDDLRGRVINDASNPGHYFWHIYTRMNWGEPWYAGFRESQTEYRLKNQEYFRRNLMPCMLGWFNITAQTSLEDIEWLLARAAGFDNLNLDLMYALPDQDLAQAAADLDAAIALGPEHLSYYQLTLEPNTAFHQAPPPLPDDDLLALDEALDRLSELDPRAAELVKLCFFVGLTQEQAAQHLDVSVTTVERLWAFARAWLFQEIERGRTPPG
jgi:RNA polymerase sigma factor (sigma-70 family)